MKKIIAGLLLSLSYIIASTASAHDGSGIAGGFFSCQNVRDALSVTIPTAVPSTNSICCHEGVIDRLSFKAAR